MVLTLIIGSSVVAFVAFWLLCYRQCCYMEGQSDKHLGYLYKQNDGPPAVFFLGAPAFLVMLWLESPYKGRRVGWVWKWLSKPFVRAYLKGWED